MSRICDPLVLTSNLLEKCTIGGVKSHLNTWRAPNLSMHSAPHVADGFEGYKEDPPRSLLRSCNIGLNFLLQNPHILVEKMVARALKFKSRESGPAPE
jgi:hypothetical protein